MHPSFMQNELVLALCWTLIHSLWQGLLLATVTGAVMTGTRRASAGKRYRVLTVLFFVFMAVTVITFVKEYNAIAQVSKLVELPQVGVENGAVFSAAGFTDAALLVANKPLLEKFKDYFNTHASLIVVIWFVIFIARFIRLVANLVYVQRLRNYKTFAPPLQWADRIGELVVLLGLKKKITLLESGIVKVPVAMGVLKPVILLPLGLLAHLPADEIEAILLHELAHIRRRDYLVNLLQNFAETIFFFNPALMWVSSMIREERENCCDDIAISVTNSKSNFINALIAFQEYDFAASKYAVGFPGRKNQMLNRVKRIINEKNKTLNAVEKSLLTFGMGVFILFSFAAAKKITPPVNQPKQQNGVTKADGLYLKSDTLPYKHKQSSSHSSGRSVYGEEPPATHLKSYSPVLDSIAALFTGISVNISDSVSMIRATHKNGTEYAVNLINDSVKAFLVNGKKVADMGEYSALIQDIMKTLGYYKDRSRERQDMNYLQGRKMMLDKQNYLADKMHQAQEQRQVEWKKQQAAIESKQQRLDSKTMYDDSVQVKKKLFLQKKHGVDSMPFKKTLDIKTKGTDGVAYTKKEILLNNKIQMNGTIEIKNKTAIERKIELKNRAGSHEKIVVATDAKYETRQAYEKLFKKNNKNDLVSRNDSLRKLMALNARSSTLNKQEAKRDRQAEDEKRTQVSASTIKNIIGDLEKEGQKINMENGWFALDKGQFVVDGKKMSEALHEKFIAKYVTSAEGLGYYYGPVQVTGRGVFLEYKNLVK